MSPAEVWAPSDPKPDHLLEHLKGPLSPNYAARLILVLIFVLFLAAVARRRRRHAVQGRSLVVVDAQPEGAILAPDPEQVASPRGEALEGTRPEALGGLVLSSDELALVTELRQRVEGGADGIQGGERWYEDTELLRFVRARKTITASEALFREAMAWRRGRASSWGVETTAGSFGAENDINMEAWERQTTASLPAWWTFLKANLPQGVCGHDSYGLPVYYSSVGQSDLQGCEREVGLDSLQRYCVMQNDSFLDHARRQTMQARNSNCVFHGGTIIVDLEGLAWRHVREAQVFMKLADPVKILHPERQKRCFIVRAPRLWVVVWKIIRPVIDQRTAERITVLGARDSVQPLIDEVGSANVPRFLGGTSDAMPAPPAQLVAVGAFGQLQRSLEECKSAG